MNLNSSICVLISSVHTLHNCIWWHLFSAMAAFHLQLASPIRAADRRFLCDKTFHYGPKVHTVPEIEKFPTPARLLSILSHVWTCSSKHRPPCCKAWEDAVEILW
eukprot:scpid52829/ scgid23325/ 